MYFSIAVLSWKRQRILSRVSCWKSPSFWRFRSFKGFHAQQRSWPQSCMELETSWNQFFIFRFKSKRSQNLQDGLLFDSRNWAQCLDRGQKIKWPSQELHISMKFLWMKLAGTSNSLEQLICEWQSCLACAKKNPSLMSRLWNHIASIWRKYQKSIAWDAKPCGHHLHASERRGLPRAQSTDTNLKNANLSFFLEMTPAKWKLLNSAVSRNEPIASENVRPPNWVWFVHISSSLSGGRWEENYHRNQQRNWKCQDQLNKYTFTVHANIKICHLIHICTNANATFGKACWIIFMCPFDRQFADCSNSIHQGWRKGQKMKQRHNSTHRIHVWYIYLHFYIYHKNQPNVGKYTIHGSHGQ